MNSNNNKTTVARTLQGGFGLMILIILAMLAPAFYGLSHGQASLKTIYEDRSLPLQQLGRIHYLTARSRIVLMDAVAHPQPQTVSKRLQQHADARTETEALWKAYAATYLTDEEKVIAARTRSALTALETEGLGPVASALQASRHEEARQLLDTKVSPLNPAVVDALEALIALQLRVAEAEFQSADSAATRALWVMGTLAAGGLLIAVVGAGWISRRIVNRLGAEPAVLAAAADRIAAGDLAEPAGPAAAAGSVLASLHAMRAALAQLVGGVRQGVDQVAIASAQIASGNIDLCTRTEQQASSLQQAAATMEQVTGTVRNSADSARQANELARQASEVARQGGEVTQQVVATMREIEADSRKIADITAVIDGIAFQTNILALNAAVEAARAGEQGRGFAVVASEVRSLAQRSAEAARQISGLIAASVQRVEAGSALVQNAGQTMEQIVTGVHQVSTLIGEITTASGEQSQGMAQFGDVINQLDQATQQNAALVEESAAAADSLKQQARTLADSVAVFRLEARPA